MPPTWTSEYTGVAAKCSGTAQCQVREVIGAYRYSHAMNGISAQISTALEYSHSTGSHHCSGSPERTWSVSAVKTFMVQIAATMPPKIAIWQISTRRRMPACVSCGAGEVVAI